MYTSYSYIYIYIYVVAPEEGGLSFERRFTRTKPVGSEPWQRGTFPLRKDFGGLNGFGAVTFPQKNAKKTVKKTLKSVRLRGLSPLRKGLNRLNCSNGLKRI